MRSLGFIVLTVMGCTTNDDSLYDGPTGSGNDIFCSVYSEADEFVETPISLQGSGRLKVQLLVDRGNPKDGVIKFLGKITRFFGKITRFFGRLKVT